MKINITRMFLIFTSFSLTLYGQSDFSGNLPKIDSTLEKGVCSMKIDNVDVDNFKCEVSRAPSLLFYSKQYWLNKKSLYLLSDLWVMHVMVYHYM